MRAARTSLLLVAFALLASALHLTLALPAEKVEVAAAAEEAAAAPEAVSQRDPEEHPAPAPAAPAYHFPRPSEIIHAVGSYVHGAHQQQHQEQHEHVQEHVQEHHEHHHRPTTHRPPHRPLHAEKEKIKVTKTVLVEFTKLVTRHPVCMKVYGVKPPCLPFQAYSASGAQHGKPCNHGLREEAPAGAYDDDEEGVYADAELKEGLYISPSAVAELPAATNIVEAPEDLEAAARSARYLELRPVAPPAAPASATPALPAEQSGRQHLIAAAASAANNAAAGAGGLLGHHNRPEKIVEYKTLWVTKVEKVWDHRVTATLVAENCVPTDLKIPFCGAGYGPTYEAGDEIVYKPTKPVHKPVHHKPVHKPVHHEPVHKPVHHEPVHKPVHHEPVHKPVHHEPVHKPVHHEPVHEPIHEPVHEPVHKPVHHEPVHKPVHHEPVHKPVHHEPVHKPAHHEPAYKPEPEKVAYGVEYTEGPVEHHWREGQEEAIPQEEAVAEAAVENETEEKPASD